MKKIEIALIISKIISIIYSPIQDCDEVFNFYEPLHYALYGFGFQTWEYVSIYGLRSWAYIYLHTLPLYPASWAFGAFQYVISRFSALVSFIPLSLGLPFPPFAFALTDGLVPKYYYFFTNRSVIAFAAAYSQILLARKMKVIDSTERIAFLFLCINIFAPGMFIASPAFLPSTFGMIFITMAFSFWIDSQPVTRSKIVSIIFNVAIAGFWGWPFCLLFGGLWIVTQIALGNFHKHFFVMVYGGILSLWLIVLPLFLIDSSFYQSFNLAPLTLVLYNVFGHDGKGPSLYGTEPWYFYLTNGFLNFNIAILFALASVPLLIVTYFARPPTESNDFSTYHGFLTWPLFWNLIPFYIWTLIFSIQPHKEERFSFVIYPLLAFNASVSVQLFLTFFEYLFLRSRKYRTRTFAISKSMLNMIYFTFVTLSLLRVYSLVTFYHAPISIYAHLERAHNQASSSSNQTDPLQRELFVCGSQEWYMFPSHFFMPHGTRFQFIDSGFRGLLPHYFAEPPGSREPWVNLKEMVEKKASEKRDFVGIPSNINDLNKFEADRLIKIDECDYLIKAVPLDGSPESTEFHDLSVKWTRVHCIEFLDASKTKFPQRAFYIGGTQIWKNFCLYKRK